MNTDFAIVVSHLEDALKQFRQGHPEGAAWRLADGALLLRRELEAVGYSGLAGLDEPTGRGALLPREHDPVREALPDLLVACEALVTSAAANLEGMELPFGFIGKIHDLQAAIAKAKGLAPGHAEACPMSQPRGPSGPCARLPGCLQDGE